MIIYNHENLVGGGGGRSYRAFAKTILAEPAEDKPIDGFSIHTFHPTVEGMVDGYKEIRALIDQYWGTNFPLAVTAAQVWAAQECPYEDSSPEEKAEAFGEMYACLANEGAAAVQIYKTSDRAITHQYYPPDQNGNANHSCGYNFCGYAFGSLTSPGATQKSGILGPHYNSLLFEPDGECASYEMPVIYNTDADQGFPTYEKVQAIGDYLNQINQ